MTHIIITMDRFRDGHGMDCVNSGSGTVVCKGFETHSLASIFPKCSKAVDVVVDVVVDVNVRVAELCMITQNARQDQCRLSSFDQAYVRGPALDGETRLMPRNGQSNVESRSRVGASL